MSYITNILYNFLVFGLLFYVLTSRIFFCYICKLIGNNDNFLSDFDPYNFDICLFS